MEQLNTRQCQLRLLGIAKEFAKICDKHSIPYYMIEGTFLGAIRHKGFIPWDDDMDFGIPIEYYSTLLQYLDKELNSPYRLCTYKHIKGCGTVYAKIDDTTTCIVDKCQDIALQDQLGINIDLFPLYNCNGDEVEIRRLQNLRNLNRWIFTESTKGQKYKHVAKKILKIIFPHDRKWLLDKIWNTAAMIKGEKKYLANLFGYAVSKELVPREMWGKGVEYVFEDIKLKGPEKYDEYLSQIYGNYMELPPVNMRKTHCTQVFIRTDIQ